MRAIVQRVSRCEVRVEEKIKAERSDQRIHAATIRSNPSCFSFIGVGLLVFVAVAKEDKLKDVSYIAGKIAGLRVFEDNTGRMNKSVIERNGEVMVVSQFTLYGDVRRGRRPSFNRVAEPSYAYVLYKNLIDCLQIDYGIRVVSGKFQAQMNVCSINDGPVTILIDSSRQF